MNNSIFLLATSSLMAACGTTDIPTNISGGETPASRPPTSPVEPRNDANNKRPSSSDATSAAGETTTQNHNGTANSGSPPPPSNAQPDAQADVQCLSINSCSPYAILAVTQSDIEATKSVLGDKYEMSEVHACAGLDNCAAAEGPLNWVEVSQLECSQKGGFLIATNQDG